MKEDRTKVTSYFSMLAVAALVLLAGCASPHYGATHEQIEQRITNARTRSDHLSLAEFFDAEAQEARKRAEKHKTMAKGYAGDGWGRGKPAIQAREHCETVAALNEKAAQENEALAALHRQLASESGQ